MIPNYRPYSAEDLDMAFGGMSSTEVQIVWKMDKMLLTSTTFDTTKGM